MSELELNAGAEWHGKRKAYIARYPLNEQGDDLREEIISTDGFWSPRLSAEFDRLAKNRQKHEPMIQGWYCDSQQTTCMATTNQPFKLD